MHSRTVGHTISGTVGFRQTGNGLVLVVALAEAPQEPRRGALHLICGLEFRVQGLRFRVWGLGFGVQGTGFGVWGIGVRV